MVNAAGFCYRNYFSLAGGFQLIGFKIKKNQEQIKSGLFFFFPY